MAVDAKEHAWESGIRLVRCDDQCFRAHRNQQQSTLARQLWNGSETENDGTTLEVECDASSAIAVTTRRDDKFGDAIAAALESGTSMYMQQVGVIHTDGLLLFRQAMFLTVCWHRDASFFAHMGRRLFAQTSTDPWSILVQCASVEEGKTNVYLKTDLFDLWQKDLKELTDPRVYRIDMVDWRLGVRERRGALICVWIV